MEPSNSNMAMDKFRKTGLKTGIQKATGEDTVATFYILSVMKIHRGFFVFK